jgi:hypothetical protein
MPLRQLELGADVSPRPLLFDLLEDIHARIPPEARIRLSTPPDPAGHRDFRTRRAAYARIGAGGNGAADAAERRGIRRGLPTGGDLSTEAQNAYRKMSDRPGRGVSP